MEQFPQGELEPHSPEIATLENIRQAFEEWEYIVAGNDPYLKAMGKSLADLMRTYAPFRDSIEMMLQIRHEPETIFKRYESPAQRLGPKHLLTKQYAANLIRCSLTNILLHDAGGLQFPRDFKESSAYTKIIIQKYDESARAVDPSEENWVDMFESNLMHRFIQTNVPERYKGIALAKYVYGDDFPKVIRNVDVGCSLGEGMTQLALNVPFNHLDVMTLDPSTGLLIPDREQSQIINPFINEALNIEYSVGVDIIYPRNEDNANWVWSCRRPQELTDRDMINRDYLLTSTYLPRVGYVRGNFADSDDISRIKNKIKDISATAEVKAPNVVSIFTVAYECSDDEVTTMMKHAGELIEDVNGMVIFQEPGEVDPTAPNGLRFEDDFRIPGKYKTMVWRPHQPERGIEIVAAYSDGRCSKAIINTDLIGR
jgi:hypothetical protein